MRLLYSVSSSDQWPSQWLAIGRIVLIILVGGQLDFIWLFVSESDLMSNGQGFRPQIQVQAFIDCWYVGE